MKLKIWEMALICAVLVTFLFGLDAFADASALSDKLVRLHVVANSDTEADQALKLKVRDAVLSELRPLLEGTRDAESARQIILSDLDGIEAAAREAVRAWGSDCGVAVTLLRESFPTTEYENFSLPAGEYLSLRVKLGRAEGHNWWCVVFPPICDAGEIGPDTAAAVGLTESEIGIITQENTGYTVKFKFIELLSRFFKLFG